MIGIVLKDHETLKYGIWNGLEWDAGNAFICSIDFPFSSSRFFFIFTFRTTCKDKKFFMLINDLSENERQTFPSCLSHFDVYDE